MNAAENIAQRIADIFISDLNNQFGKVAAAPAPGTKKSSLVITSGHPQKFANEVIYERETINDFLCRGETTIILAQPATGKTGLALTYMLAICADRPDIAGEKVLSHTGAVIYVAGERGAAIKRRWAALLKRHGLENANLPHEPIFLTSPNGIKVVRSEDGRGGGRIILTEQGKEIMDMIEVRGDVALVIYDTQTACLEGIPESNNEAIGAAYIGLDTEAEKLNVATAVLHHMPKAAGKTGGAGEMMAARGASAGVAAVGNVITLTELDRDENEKLPRHLRNRIVRLDGAKCNEAEWAKRRHFKRDAEPIQTVNRKTGAAGKPSSGAILVPEQINLGWQPDHHNSRLSVLTAVRDADIAGTPLRLKGSKGGNKAGTDALAERFGAKAAAIKDTFEVLRTDGLITVGDSEKSVKGHTHEVWAITTEGDAFLQKAAAEVFTEVADDQA